MARTRSPEVHRKIVEAALELMAERGLDGASVDAIAERAGVSKMTIYGHWSDKEALFLEAMATLHGLRDRPIFDTGDTRSDMIAVLSWQPQKQRAELQQRIWPDFLAYAARSQKFGDAWREIALEPPRRELKRLLHDAARRGELHNLPSTEHALAQLLGPMMYRTLFSRQKSVRPERDARIAVDAFWRAFRPVVPIETNDQ